MFWTLGARSVAVAASSEQRKEQRAGGLGAKPPMNHKKYHSMKIKIFTIPILHSKDWEDEMNRFLANKTIVDIDRQLVSDKTGTYWTFCVQYVHSKVQKSFSKDIRSSNQKDYKKILEESTFKRFDLLREIRKQIAEKEEVPAFVVCSNAALAELAKLEEITEQTMQQIKGIGEKKAAKYAPQFVINSMDRGLPFLGYVLHSDKIHLAKRSRRRFRQKYKELNRQLENHEIDQEMYHDRMLPTIAFTLKADAFLFRRKVRLLNC